MPAVFERGTVRNGEEWQLLILALLRLRYGLNFQEVPDRDRGDLGMEGFSRTDGCIFQCYFPEEPLSIDALYEKLRTKMTEDLGKLRRNADRVAEILGPTKVSKWILVIPRHETRRINSHAESKASEIRQASLAIIDDPFFVHVVTDEHFAEEKQRLAAQGLLRLSISFSQPTPTDIDSWSAENRAQADTMLSKLPSAMTSQSPDLARELLRSYLEGRNFVDSLRSHYPQLFDALETQRIARERTLAVESLLRTGDPTYTFTTVLTQINGDITSSVPAISPADVRLVAISWIVQWLMACPLRYLSAYA